MKFDELVKKKKIDFLDLNSKALHDGDLDVPIKVIQKSEVLEDLDLDDNSLTLADGKFTNALAHNRTIRLLSLSVNNIGHKGAKHLAATLEVNQTLQKIHLGWNPIGDEGTKYLAEALSVNKSLKEIYLNRNNIGDDGAQSLATAIESNQSLRVVYLRGNGITDEGAKRLANALENNHSIETFELWDNDVSHEVLKKIDDILHVKNTNFPFMLKSMFDDLVKKKEIEFLRRKLHDGDLDVLIKVLQKSEVLKKLYLESNSLTLADGKFTNALAHNRTIRYLSLADNNIGDKGAKHLAAALKANQTLHEIHLGSNKIGDEGTKYLAEALSVNKSLKEIYLNRNNIGNDGAQSLATAIESNQSLHEVYQNGNGITDEGAKRLANALENNHSIKKFDLSDNDVSRQILKMINGILEVKNRKDPLVLKAMIRERDKQLATKNEQIAQKEEEVSILKAQQLASFETIESLKSAIKAPLDQLKMIVDTVDLTNEDYKPSNKRTRTENAATTNLARLVRVKQEKADAETTLKSVREEKETAEVHLEEARDDLGDANELVQQQALATDIWQRRFDELASLVSGKVDGATISDIRNRSLARGS